MSKKSRVGLYRPIVPKNKTVVNLGKGFPKKIIETHRYCEQVNLTTGVGGVLSVYNFSCNGMYDPNVSGTGHQPMFFDQVNAIYNQYCVIGSKITVEWTCPGAAINMVYGIVINDNTAAPPSLNAAMEHPSCISRTYPYNAYTNPSTFMTKKFSAKQNFGRVPVGNSAFTGNGSTNPSEQMYYQLFVDSSAVSTQGTLTAKVTIDYIAVWTERNDIATS